MPEEIELATDRISLRACFPKEDRTTKNALTHLGEAIASTLPVAAIQHAAGKARPLGRLLCNRLPCNGTHSKRQWPKRATWAAMKHDRSTGPPELPRVL